MVVSSVALDSRALSIRVYDHRCAIVIHSLVKKGKARSYAAGIFYDHEILEEAISSGITLKAGGYGTVFLTVAGATGSELLTDDRLQHINALKRGLKSHLLREMVEAPS